MTLILEQDEYTNLLETVREQKKFDKGIYSPTLWGRIPRAGELSISAGRLGTVARATFQAEKEYQTLRYLVISDQTPLLWYGTFGWIFVSRRHFSGVGNDDYLLMLEIAYDLDKQGV